MYAPPFHITDLILHLVADISEQVGALNARMGDRTPAPMLRKENRIRTIHSSLAIEHNSLSLQQVTDIVNGKHVLGAPNEIAEVKNAVQAYQLLQQIDPLSERDLLRAHRLMMQGLIPRAGQYRTDSVGVFDGERCIHLAPPYTRVPELMAALFAWVRTTPTHPLVSSCVFHYEFEFIHPFMDGNGRIGRYWQTALLSRWNGLFAWLPVETIVKAHQADYYNAIARADAAGDSTCFVEFMLHCLLDSIQETLRQQQVADKVTDKTEKVADKTEGVTDKVADKISVEENKIEKKKATSSERLLQLLAASPRMTIPEMMERLQMSDSGVRKVLNRLRKEGLLTRIGSNKTGSWQVLNNVPTLPKK